MIYNKRFPLDDTSTVYMNGKAVYNLMRHDKPGIIAPVELRPNEAAEFRAEVNAAIEEAWMEGVSAVLETVDRELAKRGLGLNAAGWRIAGERGVQLEIDEREPEA